MSRVPAVLIPPAALAVLVSVVAAQSVPQPKIAQKTVAVPGNRDFTNTGYTIGPNDRVTISASGTVRFSAGADASAVGPNGWPRNTYANSWPDDYNACADPLEEPAAGHAALIADVNGERFVIGTNRTFSGKDGLLYLGINDCSFTGGVHNTGQFSANVKVERDAVGIRK
jgi:hypothetical protein